MHPIDIDTACANLQAGYAVLVDVRTPGEFEDAHARGAHNIPLDKLTPANIAALNPGCKTLYLICKSGMRAARAQAWCASNGITDSLVVDGGTDAWRLQNKPVETGRPMMSLERQIRIAAGALTAAGTLSGILLHPAALALPLFVGCGLVFSGVTDSCAMGVLLARMPWNQSAARNPKEAAQ